MLAYSRGVTNDELLYNHLYSYLFSPCFFFFAGLRALSIAAPDRDAGFHGADYERRGLNLVALNRFVVPENAYGLAFTLIIMGIAAAETAVALGIIILIFRKYRHIEGDRLQEMKD